ncbi:MAG: phosphatase PAP2 family protein [Saprospiraceae bacterium]|nr:phosphatase PAP2 family protein [Saprospiraceae bacterium]
MKKISVLYIQFFVLVLVSTLINACQKTAETTELEAYLPTNLDETGGSWKPFLVTSGTDITVASPTATTSAEYQAELAAVKTAANGATAEQKAAIKYWSAGAVIRWNEIARDLAAQYNIPPKNNPDGTYPAPDANNPLAYPRFPFANPPYASRAFALLSVAQYDALIATWKYKMQYKRSAPYKVDATLTPSVPKSELPSYPSEDAVVAAASRELLKLLFPGEAPLLESKATEHKNSRIWAGANVQSDIDAGEALGKAVAAKVIAYAKADNMSKANAQADVPKLRDDATKRGITTQWTSRDLPARPPMLPFFGNVKTWNFDSATKVAIRPTAPPAVGSADFNKALDELRAIAKNRSREQFRIASFWADGPGTYTPPGHWNRFATELIYKYKYSEIRAARTLALMNTAVEDAGVVCWDVKYYYLLPRPTEADPSVTTSTGIPNFPAFTSGHSTFSAAGATVLSYIFPNESAALNAYAKEASESRIYGCIHYRFDCEIGLTHGKKVGDYAVNRGKADGSGL